MRAWMCVYIWIECGVRTIVRGCVCVCACAREDLHVCVFFLRVNSDQPSQLMHTYNTHYRVAKTHRMPSLYRSSSAKEPNN